MYILHICLFKYITAAALRMVKVTIQGSFEAVHEIVMEITLLIMGNHEIVFLNF